MTAPYPADMPADLRDLLEKDPRVAAFEAAPAGNPYRAVLEAQGVAGPVEERFAQLQLFHEDPFEDRKWINKPAGFRSSDVGRGKGVAKMGENPVIEEYGPRPAIRADIFREGSWMVVSQAFDTIVRRFDAAAIESIPAEWRFQDGGRTDGVRFLDVTRKLDAFDYRHSEVRLYIEQERKDVDGLNFPRALKPGIPEGVHLFRDSWLRSEMLISLALARALADAGMRGFRAVALGTGRAVPLDYRH
jgi:hypothetical protein